MAHHPVVNFHQLPGSPALQPLRSNAIVLSESSTQPPLDLNFSQKLSQNPQRGQFEAELGPSLQQKESEASPSSQRDFTPKIMSDCATPNGVFDCPSSKAVCDAAPSKILRSSASQKSRCHWTHGEVLALFDAKKTQAERIEKGGRCALGKWEEIAEFCSTMGIKKLPSQCRDKWERLWPSFKKILDWERQPPAGKGSYWAMLGDEREREGFPRVFDKEIYDALSCRFGFIRSLNLSSIVVSSSDEDSVEAATNTCNEPVQNGTTVFEDVPSVVDDHAPISTDRKRKSTARSNGIKKPPAESSKRTLLCSETKEENGAARSSKDVHVKNKSADFSERRLFLEERKMRLAERKFLLDEKKLQATLEIGRGLIASMERMTNTISGLGASSSLIN